MTYKQRARLEDAIERYGKARAVEAVVYSTSAREMAVKAVETSWGEISRLLNALETEWLEVTMGDDAAPLGAR